MSHYSDSDEEEVYEEEYCMKMAASLEAKLHFSRSQSAESNGGGGGGGGGAGIGRAWQGGGATKKTYNTFHVDSFGEEDDFMDDYEFSCVAVCTYDTTTQVPDHALRTESSGDHALNLDSMGSEEGAAVATGGISPGPAAGGYIFDVGGVNEDDDDGWNSDEGGGGWGLEGPGGIQQDTTPTKGRSPLCSIRVYCIPYRVPRCTYHIFNIPTLCPHSRTLYLITSCCCIYRVPLRPCLHPCVANFMLSCLGHHIHVPSLTYPVSRSMPYPLILVSL